MPPTLRLTKYRFGLLGITLFAAIGSLICAGCGRAPVAQEREPATVASPARPASTIETWELLYMQGHRVGYAHTRMTPTTVQATTCWQIASTTQLELKRFGQSHRQTIELNSLETVEGTLRHATVLSSLGPTPIETTIKPMSDGSRLILTTRAGEQASTAQLPWQPSHGGFFAIELSLRNRPPKPGERRQLTCLMPLVNQVAQVEMQAGDWQPTAWFDGSQKTLLAIETKAKLSDGNVFRTTYWVNDAGEPLKSRTDALNQETYRTDKATSLAPAAAFDLAVSSSVPVEMPMPDPLACRSITYRVELADGSPRDVFMSTARQTIRDDGPHRALLQVRGSQANGQANANEFSKDSDNPLPLDLSDALQPNELIQSQAEEVVRLANEVPADASQREIARRLTDLVHRRVAKKNFSQAFASAADVAKTLEGDCTEHAVLLAALLRARQIPARVAIGLVYVPGMQALGYHMWTEAWLAGDAANPAGWLPLDATLPDGRVGPTHLHLASSSLAGASAYSAFLPVAQVLGRLKIEVVDYEAPEADTDAAGSGSARRDN